MTRPAKMRAGSDPADRLDAVALLSLLCGGMPEHVRYCEHPGNPQPKERPRVYRGFGITPTRTVRASAALAWSLKATNPPTHSVPHPVALVALFYRKDRRGCDIDNLLKLVMDAGNQARIWHDDCLVKAVSARMSVDGDNPRTVVAWCEMVGR